MIRKYIILLVVAVVTGVGGFFVSIASSAVVAWTVYGQEMKTAGSLAFSDFVQATFPLNAMLYPAAYGVALIVLGFLGRRMRRIKWHFTALIFAMLVTLPTLAVTIYFSEKLTTPELIEPAAEPGK